MRYLRLLAAIAVCASIVACTPKAAGDKLTLGDGRVLLIPADGDLAAWSANNIAGDDLKPVLATCAKQASSSERIAKLCQLTEHRQAASAF
ncbi:hypothetical protein AE925_11605 [Xanthomonas arboricola]|uniref:hypothetical protein n=1 Tax=Xanthomonas arboricola TaxID=56448 RepID=UPI00069D9B01|nr:hypothetical protein [Xanthomonas arboricola]KOB18417.1 hypothetical protein AE925_11605 [Xanthomonas arboricola]